MPLRFLHVLVALLIAILAIGAPPPAKAACVTCVDCTAEAPAKNQIPCPDQGRACQIAQTCAPQLQKAPAQSVTFGVLASGKADFGDTRAIAIKPAFLKPETSPPRT